MEPSVALAETNQSAPARKALVLFNEKAGSVQPGDGERLMETLTHAGVAYTALMRADRMSRRLFMRAREFDVIIVLGGDGTARAAAAMAPRDGPPLVLLPGGTLNILPKALYGDLPWREALEAVLARGVERRMPAGIANGERFFVAAMFGAPTVLARVREAAREGQFATAVGRMGSYFKRAFTRSLRARAGRETFRKVEAVGALLPSFGGGLEGESLEWVHLKANHFVDLARVSVRALGEGWRDDEAVEIWPTHRADVVSSGMIPSTLDGEPHNFYGRVHISYDPKGVRVLALEPEKA
ncbi:MAG TPA: diacylglycerol kinase family protein [Terricaulis sp.]|nr:diacylglycerol kinase family protein [Terricaulis sp.]HRP10587.1 diacylglycerol kinase family protein [Terricaulis sp.]